MSKLTAQPFDLQPSTSVQSGRPLPEPDHGREAKNAPIPARQSVELATARCTPTFGRPLCCNRCLAQPMSAGFQGTSRPDPAPGRSFPVQRDAEHPETRCRIKTEAAKLKAILALYPPLPELPAAPAPEPGPNGQPYTLAELQQIAAREQPDLAAGGRGRGGRTRQHDPGRHLSKPNGRPGGRSIQRRQHRRRLGRLHRADDQDLRQAPARRIGRSDGPGERRVGPQEGSQRPGHAGT